MLIVKPARMQVQLYVVPGRGYPSRDAPHRLITEMGRLQSFNEEGSAHPEFGEDIEQEAKPMLLPVNLSQNYGFGDRMNSGFSKLLPTLNSVSMVMHTSVRFCAFMLRGVRIDNALTGAC